MNRTFKQVGIAASLALNVGVFGVLVWRELAPGPGGAPGAERPLDAALADRLGLDEAGRARFEALRGPVAEARAATRGQSHVARAEMIAAVVAGDEPAAQAARERLVARQLEFQRAVVHYLATLARDLDGRQREVLADFLNEALFPGLGGRPPHDSPAGR